VSLPGAVVTALAVPVLLLGVFWSGLYETARFAGAFAAAAPAARATASVAPAVRD
jgi:Na+(H+)/acetate symporter ActP